MNTKLKQINLVDTVCAGCGMDFSVPDWFLTGRREDGQTFYCPAGHHLSFRKTELDRLRERADRLSAQNTHLADQAAAAERALRATKGQVTKLKKRVANGVCPCCNRSFANLARHMSGQHPDFEAPS
jgi:hypothetical protein